ncbi:hypothetical protein EW146_g8697 [Bondarzewia mesenterica]|uniref:Uncharacterized protein n=1 Tax=Bondarzewia mesenterica TaxID=1095465 RepID=A0A4S4LCI5_9AGAM|nr:hypothetical protein EW146_g8697 [Bondarzewia mesenterica]
MAKRANQLPPLPTLHKSTPSTRSFRNTRFASKSKIDMEADEEEDSATVLEELCPQDPDTTTDNDTGGTTTENVMNTDSGRKYIIGTKLIAHGEPITLDSISTSLLLFAKMIYKQILKHNIKPVRDSLRAFAMVLCGLDDDIRTEKILNLLADAAAGTHPTTNTADIQNSIFNALAAQETRLDKKFAELTMKLLPNILPLPLAVDKTHINDLGKHIEQLSSKLAGGSSYRDALLKHAKSSWTRLNPQDPPPLDSIREKANKIIAAIAEDPKSDPGFQVTIRQITCICTGGLLLELNSADTVEWLSSWGKCFTAKLSKGICLCHRLFPVLVKFTPLSFRPTNPPDLREIEEVNGLEEEAIVLARWVKLIHRCSPT